MNRRAQTLNDRPACTPHTVRHIASKPFATPAIQYNDYSLAMPQTAVSATRRAGGKRQANHTSTRKHIECQDFNPNLSLDFGWIVRLCSADCSRLCRRRSGLRRGGDGNKAQTETDKTAEEQRHCGKIYTLRPNGRFGLNDACAAQKPHSTLAEKTAREPRACDLPYFTAQKTANGSVKDGLSQANTPPFR